MNARMVRLVAATLVCQAIAVVFPTRGAEPPPNDAAVRVRKIWDRAPHNAFTDLLFHNNEWFCVFREGRAHVSPDGALRVLVSRDGDEWTSAALVTTPNVDLRDAKISVAPDGDLVLCGAGVTQPPEPKSHQSYLWRSTDGRKWSEPVAIGDKNFWIWRITWRDGIAYGVGYQTEPDPAKKSIRLYKSEDGKKFDAVVADMGESGYRNESSLFFDGPDSALCVARRDPTGELKQATALLGRAKAPFTEWTWTDLGVQVGGPQIVRLDDGRLVVGGRSYPGGPKTKLWFLDPEKSALREFATLPSGGDTSYPGLVQRGDELWVSYYSSHEGKTSVYLARVALPK